MLNKILIVIALVLTITGCNTIPVQTQPIIVQENLLSTCTDDTPLPTISTVDSTGQNVYNGKEIMRVLVLWQSVYNDCANKHNSLVKTIRDLQETKQIKGK